MFSIVIIIIIIIVIVIIIITIIIIIINDTTITIYTPTLRHWWWYVEWRLFLRQLAEKLTKKNDESCACVITWLRARLSFEILRSIHPSVRGSRTSFHRRNEVPNTRRF